VGNRIGITLGVFAVLFVSHFFIKKRTWFSSFDAQYLVSKYTQKEIEHFSNFAFQNWRIVKWRENPRIKLLSNSQTRYYTDRDVFELVKACIQKSNRLLEEIQIYVDDQDINVVLTLKDSIHYNVRGRAPTYVSSIMIPYPTVIGGEVQVVVGNRKLDEINSTVFHEFSHLLGFHHNLELFEESEWTYKSLFNPPTKTFIDSLDRLVEDFTEYSDLDKAAIRIMYDKDVGIDPGLTKEKFFRMIEKAKKEMRK